MNGMREKIARAIDPEVWADDLPVPTRAAIESFHARRHESVAKADAVLDALMEPTEGMVRAGRIGMLTSPEDEPIFASGFVAAIRAAREGK